MKNKRLLIALIAALSFGIVAAIAVKQYLTRAQAYSRADPVVEGLQRDVGDLKTDFKRLSAEQVSERINVVSQDVRTVQLQLNELNRQLAAMQQIISPNNASEILTVARMKDEILSRREFENRFTKEFGEKWQAAESKLDKTDDRVGTLQAWIWGSLVTLIVALCGASLFLLRRFTYVIRMLENQPALATESQVVPQLPGLAKPKLSGVEHSKARRKSIT